MTSTSQDLRQRSASAPPSPPTPRLTRLVAIAGVAALLIGVLGGYVLRWGTETTKTVTKTVTNTITAPAYTHSSSANAHVSFDGTQCLYGGPAEVTAGTLIKFRYTSSVTSRLAVLPLERGTTWDTVTRAVANGRYSQPPAWVMTGVTDSIGIDNSGTKTLATASGVDQVYAVFCGTPASAGDKVAAATLIHAIK